MKKITSLILLAGKLILCHGAAARFIEPELSRRPVHTRPMQHVKTDVKAVQPTATVGQAFSITLDENPTTGYKWTNYQYDSSSATLVCDQYVAPTVGLMGSGGKRIITLVPLKTGTISFAADYRRPWESKDIAAAQTYSVTYIVNEK